MYVYGKCVINNNPFNKIKYVYLNGFNVYANFSRKVLF